MIERLSYAVVVCRHEVSSKRPAASRLVGKKVIDKNIRVWFFAFGQTNGRKGSATWERKSR